MYDTTFYFSDRSKQFSHNSDFNVLRRGYSEGAELKAGKYEGKHEACISYLKIYPVNYVLRDFVVVIIDVFYHLYEKKSTMGYIRHLSWTQTWRATQQTR